jgi:hypothetical protein
MYQMNKESFLSYFENTRDCEEAALDAAVKKGLYKAKNDRTDFRKLLALAAACVFTLAICFSVNLRPVKLAAEEYCQRRSAMIPVSGEVLESYIKDINDTIERYLGGN